MGLLIPLDVGLVMGLLLSWAVLGLALAFRLLDFPDLTIEGSLPLGAAVFAALRIADVSILASLLLAVSAGGAAGALTGLLHVRFKVNKFLAGIIVIAITYSLSLRIMGGSNIGLLQLPTIFDIVQSSDNVPSSRFHLGAIIMLAAFICIGASLLIVGLATRRGVRLRVAGSNPEYARSLGISVPFNVIAALAITNALAAFSGVLLAMNQGFADVGMGQGVLILALAAMTIGERLLPEERLPFRVFVIFAAILGSITYQILVAYAVRAGLAPTDLKLATALVVFAVVALRMSTHGDLSMEAQR